MAAMDGLFAPLGTTASFSDRYTFEDDSTLGKGTVATVCCARDRATGELVAVKKVPCSASCEASKEAKVLQVAQLHRHVVRLHGFFHAAGGGGLLVLDCHRAGDLRQLVQHRGPLAEASARRKFRGVVAALVHLHILGIVHRDVRPANVLIDEQGESVLTDFGMAMFEMVEDAGSTSSVASCSKCEASGFCAPEVMMGRQATCKADCFSLGVLLFFLLTGESPFEISHMRTALLRTVNCHIYLNGREHPAFRVADPSCGDCLRSLVCTPVLLRSSAEEAAAHGWLSKDLGSAEGAFVLPHCQWGLTMSEPARVLGQAPRCCPGATRKTHADGHHIEAPASPSSAVHLSLPSLAGAVAPDRSRALGQASQPLVRPRFARPAGLARALLEGAARWLQPDGVTPTGDPL